MKKNLFLLVFSALIGINTYAQKPKADFDVVINYNCYYAQTKYVNKSTDAVRYFWKIDGIGLLERFEPNIERYYTGGESYTTMLIAVSADGQRDSLTKVVDIDQLSKAIMRYSRPDSVYFAPATIQFFNESYLRPNDGLFTFSWDFGHGNEVSENNPAHTFNSPGTYYVSLTGNTASCEIRAHETVIIKDTAQFDEFNFIKSGCNQNNLQFPISPDFGKKYSINNDTLKVLGLHYGNCGTKKTATIRYRGDTIQIKTWDVGMLATCGCEYYFEIDIPHYSKDSAIVFFNAERVQSILSAVPQVNVLDQSIRIYPNPASDNFQVEIADNSAFPLTMIIKNIEGRKIAESIVNQTKTNIQMSELKSGIYFLYLYSKKGSVTKKILKI